MVVHKKTSSTPHAHLLLPGRLTVHECYCRADLGVETEINPTLPSFYTEMIIFTYGYKRKSIERI